MSKPRFSSHLTPILGTAESDARFNSFDFREAHAAAPPDLQQLLDNTESLPFRRRGYERDGMLKTLVERAGFAELYESSQSNWDSKTALIRSTGLPKISDPC